MAHVYKMNEYEWWASNLPVDETLELYLKKTGASEDETDPIEDIRECNLDNEGMYIEFEDEERIKELEAQGIIEVLVDDPEGKVKNGFGSIMKCNGEWWIKVPFRKALEHNKFTENDEPYCIASTEW